MATARTVNMDLPTRIITKEELSEKQLEADFQKFKKRIPRYNWLEEYYIGAQGMVYPNRQLNPQVNYCQRFVDNVVGYLTGNPPSYSAGDVKDNESIVDVLIEQNQEQLEGDLIQDLCIFGGVNQLVYTEDGVTPKTALYRPDESYIAYSPSVDKDSVYGAIVQTFPGDNDNKETYQVDIYTSKVHIVYTVKGGKWSKDSETIHKFGRVPLIEYRNGKYAMSLYEQIISLQDAYNGLFSDRTEDKRKFAASTMVIKGSLIGMNNDQIRENLEGLKDVPVVQINHDDSLDYVTKTMNEADNQVLQDALANEMYQQVGIPNISDEAFSNNASGIAIQFKLLGLDLTIGRIKSSFNKGFMRRIKLYDAGLNNADADPEYKPSDGLDKIEIVFKLNIPTDISYEANAYSTLYNSGLVSTKTVLDNLSIVTNSEDELTRINEEARVRQQQQVEAWGSVNPTLNRSEPDEEEDSE